jgi:TetR/AcrR family transcriptional regulator, transcriptional repressor for nem operon
MVQEVCESNPAIRAACDASISGHAAKVEADIVEAMRLYGIRAKWTAKSLALHTQAVLQGAFILAKAKAKGGAAVAAASVDHLHHYIELLFNPQNVEQRRSSHEH